jgi:aspartyl aminopeptidase
MRTGTGLFKTHYYGGIRKYQWLAVPLELHGVVALADGTSVRVRIGADPGEPKLVITDLLPHLGMEQNKKPLGEAVPGETLNLLLGSRPIGGDEESGRVKLAVMQLLYDKYGITEDDFTSAELEAVPAGAPATSAWTAA